jgi:hypothetical protein
MVTVLPLIELGTAPIIRIAGGPVETLWRMVSVLIIPHHASRRSRRDRDAMTLMMVVSVMACI